MKLGIIMWAVFTSIMYQMSNAMKSRLEKEHEYYDFDPELEDLDGLNNIQAPNNFRYADAEAITETPSQVQETTCITLEPFPDQDYTTPMVEEEPKPTAHTISADKSKELQHLVQLLYIAHARVQLEASEIKKAQAVANSAQQSLEEAANHVRSISAALQNSQHEVANAAIRAQTAQLQLAAHDQLLFAARQDVDALSSHMVALQAAEGISDPKTTVNLTSLMEKLKQPLQEHEQPTPIPPIVPMPARPLQSKTPLHHQQRYGPSLHRNPYYN